MSTLSKTLRKAAAALAVFAAAAAVLTLANGSSPTPAASPGGGTGAGRVPTGQSSALAVEAREEAVRAAPDHARRHADLGGSYLQRVRETGEVELYARAEAAFRRALALDPREAGAVSGLGTLALARHDFASALRLGRRARRLAPQSLEPFPVLVDALIELGRYRSAARSLQRWIDLKPTLASYARVAYLRELHGDLDGAAEALRLARSAGGGSAENVAFVEGLLGNLEFLRGRLGSARGLYRRALGRFPGYGPATAGLAGVEVAGGDSSTGIRRLRDLMERAPLAEHAIALAEAELAAGRLRSGQRALDLARDLHRQEQQRGVNTDHETAVFEADHGAPDQALELARRAWAAAPNVRAADALAWTLTVSGRPREGLRYARLALRLGSVDPLFLYHAGMCARAAGRPALARRWLSRALALNPRFSPLHAPRARRALRALG